MHISESRPPFANKTLLIIANTTEAKGYLASGHDITALFELKEDLHPYQSGDQALVQTPGGVTSSSENQHVSDTRRDHLFASIIEKMRHELQNSVWTEVYLAIPQAELSGFLDKLPGDMKALVKGTLGKNLLSFPENEALKALEDSRTALS